MTRVSAHWLLGIPPLSLHSRRVEPSYFVVEQPLFDTLHTACLYSPTPRCILCVCQCCCSCKLKAHGRLIDSDTFWFSYQTNNLKGQFMQITTKQKGLFHVFLAIGSLTHRCFWFICPNLFLTPASIQAQQGWLEFHFWCADWNEKNSFKIEKKSLVLDSVNIFGGSDI